MTNVATIPQPRDRQTPMMAGGAVRAIVPQSMEEAYRLATAICKAGMAPKGLDTAEKAMIAIMHGLEIGMTPMAALQRIAVVNGRPTIWGDAAIGLVRGSGLCEYVRETMAGEGDQRTAKCEAKRKGEPDAVTRTFSVADARKAKLWGKSGPWSEFPDRMLQLRARAFALRDGFADVLGGMYLREELDDQAPMRDAPPTAPPPVEQRMTPPPAPKQIAAPPAEAHDPETGEIAAVLSADDSALVKKGLIRQLEKCHTSAAIDGWNERSLSGLATLQPPDREEVLRERNARAAEIYDRENAAKGDDGTDDASFAELGE